MSSTRCGLVTSVALAFGAISAGHAGEPEQEFRWKFTAGRKLVYELKQAQSWKPPGRNEQRSSDAMRISFIGLGDGTAVISAMVPSGAVGIEIQGPRTITVPYYCILGVLGEDGGCSGPLAKDVNLMAAVFPLPEKRVAKGAEWALKMKLTTPSPEPAEAAKEVRKEGATARLEEVVGQGDKALAQVSVAGSAEQIVGASARKLSFTSKAAFLIAKGRFEEAEFTVLREDARGSGDKTEKSTRSTSGSVKLIEDAVIAADDKELLAWKQVSDAMTQIRNGKKEAAVLSLSKALELKDDLPGVRLSLVPVYGQLGKFEAAFECLAKEAKAHPEDRNQIFVYAAIIYLDAERQLGKEKRDKLFHELEKKYPTEVQGPGDAAEPDETEQ